MKLEAPEAAAPTSSRAVPLDHRDWEEESVTEGAALNAAATDGKLLLSGSYRDLGVGASLGCKLRVLLALVGVVLLGAILFCAHALGSPRPVECAKARVNAWAGVGLRWQRSMLRRSRFPKLTARPAGMATAPLQHHIPMPSRARALSLCASSR